MNAKVVGHWHHSVPQNQVWIPPLTAYEALSHPSCLYLGIVRNPQLLADICPGLVKYEPAAKLGAWVAVKPREH